MKTKSRFIEYIRLLRPQGAAATAAAILISSLIMGLRNPFQLFILFVIGVLSHTFIFVLNEYADIRVDKRSADLQEKPLVSGVIPKEHAVLIALLAAFFAFALTILIFKSVFPIIFLSLALLFGGIYDLYGKRVPGSDFFIAGACFFICLFGASTVSIQFTNLVYMVSIACFFHILFNNAVEGGLKDVGHDFLAGAKTAATRMGVKVEDGKLKVTKSFSAFTCAIKFIYISLVVLIGFQPELNLWHSNENVTQFMVVLLTVVVLVTLYKFWHPPDFDRPRLIRLFGVHEIAAYCLGPVILIPLIGYWFALLLILIPLFWFIICNIALYGKPMLPQV
jgi:4-hydroxybenzoate polyprenyltransferase